MSLNNFISYLQQILSMIDPNDPYSVALGKTALSATIRLAEVSKKADTKTIRAMRIAENQFQYLAENAFDEITLSVNEKTGKLKGIITQNPLIDIKRPKSSKETIIKKCLFTRDYQFIYFFF